MIEGTINNPGEVLSSSINDETTMEHNIDHIPEEFPCSSLSNLSKSMLSATHHLKAIADHANLQHTSHEEDCFCIQTTDANLPEIDCIAESLQTIKRVLKPDTVLNEGRLERDTLIEEIIWKMLLKYFNSTQISIKIHAIYIV